MIIPCTGEEGLKVDGFKLLSNRAAVHRLFNGPGPAEDIPDPPGYQSIRNAGLYMPVIDLIRKQLESMLSVVQLESGGKPVEIDGFRLKDLSDWAYPSACDPSEIIDHAGTRCNCNCVFCYNKGAPPSLAMQVPRRSAAEEFAEIRTRIKHFRPQAERSLFPGLGSTCEAFAHPRIMEILKELREKTGKVFRAVTNGAALTEPVIKGLADLKPVYLDISLNSSDPDRRGRLMGDRRPRVDIDALPLLKSAGIPYSVVIVPWTGVIIGPPVFGTIADRTGYFWGWLMLSAFGLISTCLFVLSIRLAARYRAGAAGECSPNARNGG